MVPIATMRACSPATAAALPTACVFSQATRSLQVCHDEWMCRPGESRAFRLEECTHEKRMPGKLDNAGLAVDIYPGNAHPALFEQRMVVRIKAVATVITFDNFSSSVDCSDTGPWLQVNGILHLNKRTCKGSYQRQWR